MNRKSKMFVLGALLVLLAVTGADVWHRGWTTVTLLALAFAVLARYLVTWIRMLV